MTNQLHARLPSSKEKGRAEGTASAGMAQTTSTNQWAIVSSTKSHDMQNALEPSTLPLHTLESVSRPSSRI